MRATVMYGAGDVRVESVPRPHVLAGKADHVEVAPLDRWLGGTFVEGTWRWDAATRRLLPQGRTSG